MATKKEKITRGQELYFRHLSLFSKAVPLTIKATIRKLIDQKGQSLNTVLTGKKEHIQTFYKDLYEVLFTDRTENIESQMHSWDIKTLCEIVFVLIDQPKIDCIKCILDQRLDLENYVNSVSLNYITFQHKWNALEKSLRKLCTDTDVKFECTSLIHSYDELKDISQDVYENLKSTKDANRHIQIATEIDLPSNLKSQTGAETLKIKVKEEVNDTGHTGYTENTSNTKKLAKTPKVEDSPSVVGKYNQTVKFVKPLSNQVVNAGESVALVCKLNTDGCQVSWSKNGEILTDTETVDILASKGSHFLIVPMVTTEDSGTYTCTYKDLFTSASVIVSNQDLHIIKPLQIDGDGDAIKYMKVSLSCTCNIAQKTPRWFHNNKEIEGNKERITAVSKDYEHKPFIHHVELSDEGEYMVVFDRVTSKTSITVQDLQISKPLHVNVDGDIREYMKISLSCTVNISRATPKWFHNNKEIKENNERITMLSTDCEYKLIIHHVEFADEGEYMVVFDRMTSKKSITVKGHLNPTIKHQIKEELYRNWIRGVLALKYLKLGLESPAEKAVISHHKQISEALPKTVSKKVCQKCNSENLLPLHSKTQCPRTQNKHKCLCSRNPLRRRLCPSNELCSEIYDLIIRDHRFEDPALKNISMDKWRSDPWSIAACYTSNTEFIHTSQYRRKKSSQELDCAELLSLFVNNKAYLPNTAHGVFDIARRHRNELLHNVNFEISEDKLCEYLSDFRDVLEVKNNSNERCFTHSAVEQSLKAFNDLKCYQIDIHTKDEIEKMKKDIRAAAMQEETNKLEAALKQKDEDFRQFQEKLKDDNSKTGEIMCEKHDGTVSTWYCTKHDELFCKSCMVKKHRMCFGLTKLKERYTDYRQISFVARNAHEVGGHISTICALPKEEFLAWMTISFETRIYKLDKHFNPIARFESPRELEPCSNCYIGNNKVVFYQKNYRGQLEFMDIGTLQILHQKVDIKNMYVPHSLVCNSDMIYGIDIKTVFSCTTDGSQVHDLFRLPGHQGSTCANSMTVSDDGEYIYCTNGLCSVFKLGTSDGKVFLEINLQELQVTPQDKAIKRHFFSSTNILKRNDIDYISIFPPIDVCYIGNSRVIVCDNDGLVLQVNSKGEYTATTIDGMKRHSNFPYSSILLDINRSSLNDVDGDIIKIFTMKFND